ncbi:hypothetical protein [Arthrobacter sp. Ld5]|uniref:hypothetical protein n=1 Tax=Arthrobacter sp. Ld5 TaxID=649152 RepID=UPI003EBA8CC4
MSTSRPVLTVLVTWGAVGALLAGCSEPTPTENTDQACASADAFTAAVDDFTDTLRPGADVEEVQAARDEVRRTFEDLMEEGGDVAEDKREALNKTVAEFRTAVDEIPDDTTLSQGLAVLRQKAAEVDTTRGEYVAELGCG